MPLELSEQEMVALAALLNEANEADRHPVPSRQRPRRSDRAEFRDRKRPAAKPEARSRPAPGRQRR
jgi:hypothetical protein